MPFHPGQEEEKKASFTPQVLPNSSPFLCYHSAKPFADTTLVAHRNGAALPLERNNYCWDRLHVSGCCTRVQPSREGSWATQVHFASHSDGEEVLLCRELVGARLSSLKTGLTVLA